MYEKILNEVDSTLSKYSHSDWDTNPYGHLIIDNFLSNDLSEQLYLDIMSLKNDSSTVWNSYTNPLENKYVYNRWDRLPKSLYSFFLAIGSDLVVKHMERISKIDMLVADAGLHGGGVHMHGNGGKLNVHQDYSIHPKTDMQRRLNIIFYLSKDWSEEWGGGLGLYHDDPVNDVHTDLEKVVDCIWNRAVIFDTAPGSWHGLPDPIECPEDKLRLSLAYYYIRIPTKDAPKRGAVRFAASENQKNNEDILKLIELRSNPETAKLFYNNKE